MILTNTETVPGKTITEFYGVVTGSTVRAKNIGRDIAAGLKNLVGGELKGYTELAWLSRAPPAQPGRDAPAHGGVRELLQEARDEALERMQAEARKLGANAVVNVRFSTSSPG